MSNCRINGHYRQKDGERKMLRLSILNLPREEMITLFGNITVIPPQTNNVDVAVENPIKVAIM